ncbi:MAG: hypothetical protein R2681_15755 [Pyrinomonadaceae bacterium]
MKNRFTILLSLVLLLFAVLGCGLTDRLTGSKDDSSSTTESGETTTSDSKSESTGEIVKVGIPECDELATYLNDNAEEIGKESIVVRGIVEMYKQTIFSNLRDSVDKMNDEEKAKFGENCKKALENVKKQVKPKE